MPSGSWIQADVKCPFYLTDNGHRSISCEGITDDSRITVSFAGSRGFDTQTRIFCTECFKNCEIYRMLDAKYRE